MDIQARAPRSPELDLTAVEAELFGGESPESSAAPRVPDGLLPEFLAFPEDLPSAPVEESAPVGDESAVPSPPVRATLPWAGRELDPEDEAAYFDVPPVPAASAVTARPADDPYVPPPPDVAFGTAGRSGRRQRRV